MGTKRNPGKFDCYAKAEPDEPIFVLLGHDRHAPTLVWLWAVLRELDSEDPATVQEARDSAAAMIEWAATHGKQVVGLGQAVLAGTLELIRMANHAVKEAKNVPTTNAQVQAILSLTVFDGPKA